jgi:Putative zinc-finger
MNWILMALAWPHPRERVIISYADGETDGLMAKAVAAHLQRCPHCRGKVASHESVLLALADSGHSVSEFELSRMIEEGRSRLLQSMGGTGIRPESTSRNPRGKAELVFGCRVPPQQESNADATLDEMYSTLLGSRAIGARGSR